MFSNQNTKRESEYWVSSGLQPVSYLKPSPLQAALVQSNRVSLWRRTKESVSVSDSSDWNCADLFSFSAFCFNPAHWWNRSNVLLSANAQQNWQPWPVKQGILVASNERECQCTWLVGFELCWIMFSRSPISAFIPRTEEMSSENHKTLSRFDFERLLFLLGYLETYYCQQLHRRTGSHGCSEERNALP